MEERPCESEEGAEGAHDYRVMVPAPGRHDGHHAWPGSGTREAMMPAQGGMAMSHTICMQQWVCDLAWVGKNCGSPNLMPDTGSRACPSEHVCVSCGGARSPSYYILRHDSGTLKVLSDWRQLPCRYGSGCNRGDRCYFRHGVEAQRWERVASATSIEDAETYQQRLSARKRRHSEISEMDD